MRILAVFLSALSLASTLVAAETPPLSHREQSRLGYAAYQRKDFVAAGAAFEVALKLRPDSPRYLYNLAAVSALAGREAKSLRLLHQLAAFGITMSVAADEDFAALRPLPEFQLLLAEFARHREPRGHAVEAFAMPDQTGIVEGIACRESTGDYFFGDVHHRCVWRRDRAGHLTRFSPPGDVLSGVFNLAVDESRQLLWLSTSMLPEAAGYTAAETQSAAIVALNLADGTIAHVHPVPDDRRPHVLGDLLLAPDGTLYATDSLAPVLWRLPANADASTALEIFVESPAFGSLQGLALVAADSKLLVSDYSNGLVAIDLSDRSLHPLVPPPNITLLGLDGLAVSGNTLFAVQNGVEPQRILRLTLSPSADAVTHAETLAAALPLFDDLTLITLVDGHPQVVAGSGWSLSAPAKSATIASHTVRVFDLAR